MICLNHGSTANALIKANGVFCVSVLPAEARAQVQALEQRPVALLVGLLQAIDPTRFQDRYVATTHAMLIYGMLNWTYTWYRPSGRLSLDALADQATQLCLQGLAGDAMPTPGPARVSPPTTATPKTRRRS